jgi:DNA-binding LytR/AlgR family response regulator
MVVDDEPLAIEAIEMHIEKFDSLKLVASCTDAIQAFDQLRNARIDLMFLDIQMPEMTGLDFLKSLKNPPKVIFTTAYREYAIQAFDLDVVDYLLKPISFERFMQAINKFYEGIPKDVLTPDSQTSNESKDAFFYVKADKKNIKIKYRDILYIESIKDYVKIVCRNKTIISKIMIGSLVEQLPEKFFIRIHRSYVVYIPNIEAFSSISVEVPGKEIPIGRNYKNETLSTLQHS